MRVLSCPHHSPSRGRVPSARSGSVHDHFTTKAQIHEGTRRSHQGTRRVTGGGQIDEGARRVGARGWWAHPVSQDSMELHARSRGGVMNLDKRTAFSGRGGFIGGGGGAGGRPRRAGGRRAPPPPRYYEPPECAVHFSRFIAPSLKPEQSPAAGLPRPAAGLRSGFSTHRHVRRPHGFTGARPRKAFIGATSSRVTSHAA